MSKPSHRLSTRIVFPLTAKSTPPLKLFSHLSSSRRLYYLHSGFNLKRALVFSTLCIEVCTNSGFFNQPSQTNGCTHISPDSSPKTATIVCLFRKYTPLKIVFEIVFSHSCWRTS